jgi:hypothetical protein
VKITQDLEQAISDGLNYYEEGLWSEQEWVSAVQNLCVSSTRNQGSCLCTKKIRQLSYSMPSCTVQLMCLECLLWN